MTDLQATLELLNRNETNFLIELPQKYLTILRNSVIIIIEKEMLNMAKFTVLFRQDYEEEWEHLILLDNEKNIVIDDAIENHKLSANDVLTLLEKYDIINVTREEIKY